MPLHRVKSGAANVSHGGPLIIARMRRGAGHCVSRWRGKESRGIAQNKRGDRGVGFRRTPESGVSRGFITRLQQAVVKSAQEGIGLQGFRVHHLWQALQAQRRLQPHRTAAQVGERSQPTRQAELQAQGLSRGTAMSQGGRMRLRTAAWTNAAHSSLGYICLKKSAPDAEAVITCDFRSLCADAKGRRPLVHLG